MGRTKKMWNVEIRETEDAGDDAGLYEELEEEEQEEN